MKSKAARAEESPGTEESKGNSLMGFVAGIAGWLVPGLGHALLRQWTKAGVYFLCVGSLACVGLAMRGAIFGLDSQDLFDRLGFFADVGAGSFYFLAHWIQTAGPDVAHATGDYGTRLFAAAGMLNGLTALEAFDLGRGVGSK